MIVIRMKADSTTESIRRIVKAIESRGLWALIKNNNGQMLVAASGGPSIRPEIFNGFDDVAGVENDGELFCSDYNSFIEAWEFFFRAKK